MVLDNLSTQQYMGITSYNTAETLSKRIGTATIAVRSEGVNSGSSLAHRQQPEQYPQP